MSNTAIGFLIGLIAGAMVFAGVQNRLDEKIAKSRVSVTDGTAYKLTPLYPE